jgi:hypothetical protein
VRHPTSVGPPEHVRLPSPTFARLAISPGRSFARALLGHRRPSTGERHRRGGPASEASSRAYTRGGLSGNRPPAPSSRVPETSPHAYARDALSVGAGAPAPCQRGGRAGARGPCRKPRGGRARGAEPPAGAPGSRPHPAPAPRAAPLARGNRRPGDGGGSLPPGRPLPARSVTLAAFPERLSARGGARRRPGPSSAARLATNSRNEHSRQAPAARAVGRPGLIPVGSRPGLGPWQGTPDVGTHAGSPLPLGRPFPPGWRQAPNLCARIGSLLPWVKSRLARTIPYLGNIRWDWFALPSLPQGGTHIGRSLPSKAFLFL